MHSFIKCPNLPQHKVALGIADGRTRRTIIDELKRAGVEVILTEKCEDLYEAVSYHPDMFIHHIGENNIIAAPNAPVGTIRELTDRGFHIIKGQKFIVRKYPGDVAYNVARIGNNALCNVEHCDKALLNCLYEKGIKIIHVKQGYAKCSTCIVDNDSVITSDEGIFNVLVKEGFDVLKITQGSIELKGLNYGFIGGASGYISKDTIAFAGDITNHPDFKKIANFLKSRNKDYMMLDTYHLMDIGTFIPLKEYCTEEIC